MSKAEKQEMNEIPESVIISQKVIPYLQSLGYMYIESEVPVPMGSRTGEADVVAYLDKEKSKPYIVVETKKKLRPEIPILDPAVQQAYSVSAALGERVRYLLVTDGVRHHWFERSAARQSLIPLSSAPESSQDIYQPLLFEFPLAPVTDPIQFSRILQSVIDVLKQEGVVFGLRMAIELNRILIAKLHDERTAQDSKSYRFRSNGDQAGLVASRIKQLYQEAIQDLGGTTLEEGIWSLSPRALLTVVKILEPYALASVSSGVRGRYFWQAFSDLLSGRDGRYASPLPLANFLIQLVHPIPGERIIDPACGTGLFLIEALQHVEAQITVEQTAPDGTTEERPAVQHSIIGIEQNAEVAELAATNLAFNDLPPKQIIRANALDARDLHDLNVEMGTFDVVVVDPPVGPLPKDEQILSQFETTKMGGKASLEDLFVEQSIKLLRLGGRVALLVPDTILSSPSHLRTRKWILQRTIPSAIISLPPGALTPLGHSGKASVLLLKHEAPRWGSNEFVLVADVQRVGYDRFGRPTGENDLPQLLETITIFRETGDIEALRLQDGLRIWQTTVDELNAERLDITWLDPEGQKLINTIKRGMYRSVELKKIAKIISGRNFKKYVEKGADTAVLIQAGAVRDLELDLDLSIARHISSEDYQKSKRAQIQAGDVLVTTTGQYLGRAAVVGEDIGERAVASGAVTIIRLQPYGEVDPFFLAAVISSRLGKEQIEGLQAAATAQPYIRRRDLGEILIPIPPLLKQQELAKHIRKKLEKARDLAQQAQQLESSAKELVVTELLKVGEND